MPRERSPATQIERLRRLLRHARGVLGKVVQGEAQTTAYQALRKAISDGDLTVTYEGPPARRVTYRDLGEMRAILEASDLRGEARCVRDLIDRELAPRPAARRPKCVWCSSRTMTSRQLLDRITTGETPHLCARHSRRFVAETNARKLRHA